MMRKYTHLIVGYYFLPVLSVLLDLYQNIHSKFPITENAQVCKGLHLCMYIENDTLLQTKRKSFYGKMPETKNNRDPALDAIQIYLSKYVILSITCNSYHGL